MKDGRTVLHGNPIFSVYSVKTVFLLSTDMILPFCQKSKDDLLPEEIHLKTTFPV